MSQIYNILWLDDEPIKALEIIREKHPEMNFEKIDYVDECENRLFCQSEKYHAVILDANGVSSDTPEKGANKSDFLSLVRHVISCKIPLYIYSGQLLRASDGDIADVVLKELHNWGLRDGENIFQKSSGPYEMIRKIESDLKNNYYYYQGHEYILDFFSKGWIGRKYKPQFDDILEYYKEHKTDKPHGNQMRQSVVKMLECIKLALGFDDEKPSDIINTLSNDYREYANMVIGALKHMIALSNAQSHDAIDEENRELFFISDFSTFFLITKWFYNLMLQLEKESCTNITEESVKEKAKKTVGFVKNSQKTNVSGYNSRKGLYEVQYEENGKMYVNLKVKVVCRNALINEPWKKPFVTGIVIDKETKNSWATETVYRFEHSDDGDLPVQNH